MEVTCRTSQRRHHAIVWPEETRKRWHYIYVMASEHGACAAWTKLADNQKIRTRPDEHGNALRQTAQTPTGMTTYIQQLTKNACTWVPCEVPAWGSRFDQANLERYRSISWEFLVITMDSSRTNAQSLVSLVSSRRTTISINQLRTGLHHKICTNWLKPTAASLNGAHFHHRRTPN
jgi:hypothetical protein